MYTQKALIFTVLILCFTFTNAKRGAIPPSGDAQLAAAINIAIGQVITSSEQYSEVLDTFGASPNDTFPCPFSAFAWPCNPVGTLADVLSSGILQICASSDGEATNDAGLTYDQVLGNYIAGYIGAWYGVSVTAKFIEINTDVTFFPSLLTALNQGQCDAVFAGVTELISRAQFVQFTCPYAGDLFGYLLGPSVPTGTYSTLQQLNNEAVTVGVLAGSAEEDDVSAFLPNVKVVYVIDDTTGLTMVENGTITAYISEIPIISFFLKTNPCAQCQVVPYGNPSPISGFTRLTTGDATDCSYYPPPSPPPCPPHPPVNEATRTEMNFIFNGMIPAN